jgi:hypothetical protein
VSAVRRRPASEAISWQAVVGKSERFIVVMKSVNADGVKEPWLQTS